MFWNLLDKQCFQKIQIQTEEKLSGINTTEKKKVWGGKSGNFERNQFCHGWCSRTNAGESKAFVASEETIYFISFGFIVVRTFWYQAQCAVCLLAP